MRASTAINANATDGVDEEFDFAGGFELTF
jgi:hypothetical protein